MAPRGRSLFDQATAAQKRAAVEAFRRTATGRAVDQYNRLERKLGGRSAVTADLLRRLRNVQVGGILKNLMRDAKGVDRYARQPRKNVLLDLLFKALGPVGSIFKSLMFPFRSVGIELGRQLAAARNLLKAFGYVTIPPPGQGEHASQSDQQRMADYLRSMGWTVGAPQSVAPSPGAPVEPPPDEKQGQQNKPKKSKSDKVKVGGRNYSANDPIVTGEMIRVTSSNVYAIGFDRDPGGAQSGMLKVQFKHKQQKSGKKTTDSAGATYAYYHVPTAVFQMFREAASKGKFVWDKLRVRGTISGHRFDYALIGISQSYVPRKATVVGNEEWYLQRSFTSGTQVLRSNMGDERVRTMGRPNNGEPSPPNRGRPSGPNRGTPNRGR